MKTLFPLRMLVLLCGVLFLSSRLDAQGFSSLNDRFEDGSIRIHLRGTHVKPGLDSAYGGVTANFGWCSNSAERWGNRIRYENPTLGDLLFMVSRMIRGKSVRTESGLEHAYGAGFIGWFQYYTNAIATDRLLVAPGFSLADYIFGIEQSTPTGIRMYDPAGYHFAAGPGLMITYAVGGGFWWDAYANYDLCFAKVKFSRANYTAVEGYPKPHFLSLGTDLHHESGIYGGFRLNTVIDRGDVNIHARRMDFSLGFYF